MSNDSVTINVLVTGVGAVIGYGIIKSLRRSGYQVRIVGLDRNPQAFGARFCDAFFPKKFPEETGKYWQFLRSLIAEEKIDLLLPGIEEDVFGLYDHKGEIDEGCVKVVLNSRSAIECGRDKWVMHNTLLKHGILTIPTVRPSVWNDCLETLGEPPFLLKPAKGSASRGQQLLQNGHDFEYWQGKYGETFIVQKIIGCKDEEYTVSVFGLADETSTSTAIFRRWLGPTGSTVKAETVTCDSEIERAVGELDRVFQPHGPTNYQFRKQDGQVYLLEINPRISSSTSIRCALGVNESRMCIEYYVLGRKPTNMSLEKGRCQRYLEDLVTLL